MEPMAVSATEPRAERALIIAFVDLSTFAVDARRVADEARLADMVDAYYELVAVAVHRAGVNVAARLQTRSFALSAETFRLLSPAARKVFKKHTPPILYIPLDAARPSNLAKWG